LTWIQLTEIDTWETGYCNLLISIMLSYGTTAEIKWTINSILTVTSY